MLYVGLTEDHRESATMFANVVGGQVISQALALNSTMASPADGKSEQSSSNTDSEPSGDHQNSSGQKLNEISSMENPDRKKENGRDSMTVKKLMDAYEDCISSLRKTQARRRTTSLKRIAPANFSKEDRHHVPEMVLEQIRSLNNLDLELYKYAKDIFARQQKHAVQKLTSTEGFEGIFNGSSIIALWKTISLIVSVVLLSVILLLFVNARRRTSKVKI